MLRGCGSSQHELGVEQRRCRRTTFTLCAGSRHAAWQRVADKMQVVPHGWLVHWWSPHEPSTLHVTLCARVCGRKAHNDSRRSVAVHRGSSGAAARTCAVAWVTVSTHRLVHFRTAPSYSQLSKCNTALSPSPHVQELRLHVALRCGQRQNR